MTLRINKYRKQLFTILISSDFESGFLKLIDDLAQEGYSKPDIYYLFLELLREIELDNRTKDNEAIYDRLCDFMDGLTSWAKKFRILPEQPDI